MRMRLRLCEPVAARGNMTEKPNGNVSNTCAYSGKSRGYAFIEFEDKKDMKEAYKSADGRKIEGRRVLVDVERGRTVETW